MKFTIKSLHSNGLRWGRISNLSRLPGVEFETPMLLFYTRGGSIPHITREVLDYLTEETIGLQVPVTSTIQCFEGVKAFGKGIAHFAGLKEMMTYCSVQDPAVKTPVGYNTKNNISIWSHNGRVSLNVEKYMSIMEAFQPDIYQALSNSDTNMETTRKKAIKVKQSNLQLLDDCIKIHNNSEVLKSKAILGSVEGGYDSDLRKASAQELSKAEVDGYVIDGLHNNGPEVENISFDKIKDILEVVVKNLPENKPRIIHGCWKPDIILKMIEMGVDIFDSSLAYVVAERKCALVFRYKEIEGETYNAGENYVDNDFEICLSDIKFKDDLGPIMDDCTCLTCRKHTKAYIYHLEDNKELLARTLLILHNLHHFMEFFKAIRKAGSQGKRIRLL